MIPNRFTVVLDANALFGALARNMLLSLAEAGFFRPAWSEEILNELEGALGSVFDPEIAGQQRSAIQRAFPGAFVNENQNSPARLPDPKDEHVLGTALAVRAPQIITDNLKDFPADILEKYEVEAVSVDAFLSNTITLDPIEAVRALRIMRERFSKPELSARALLQLMEKRGLVETASELSDYVDLL